MYASSRALCEAARNLNKPVSTEVQKITDRILKEDYFLNNELTPEIVQDFKTIWADAGIQETFGLAYKFQLTDSTE